MEDIATARLATVSYIAVPKSYRAFSYALPTLCQKVVNFVFEILYSPDDGSIKQKKFLRSHCISKKITRLEMKIAGREKLIGEKIFKLKTVTFIYQNRANE